MSSTAPGTAAPTGVLVVGEVLVDLLPRAGTTGPGDGPGLGLEGRFGGSPANVAVGLARLGVPVGFAGRLAQGGFGPWLRAHLTAEGVDLGASVTAGEPSTLAVVHLDDAGVARYEFYGPDTADWAWRPAELPDPATLVGRAVHTGSLATALRPGAEVIVSWLRDLRAGGDVAISVDPNLRPSFTSHLDLGRDVVAPVLACAHLVKVSQEDLGVLHPGEAGGSVAARWLAAHDGLQLVVVTAGGDGAEAWHRNGRHVRRSGPPVDVVDTVGAGDAFTAGLLGWLAGHGHLSPAGLAAIDGPALETALDRANRVAAVTCTRAGADPPRAAEL
jgi:fructokinase